MAYPFFSLSKSHRVTPIDFRMGALAPPDRAAACGFYLALVRSAVCAPSILRCPSPSCDPLKTK
jgi:hypothetical protein